METTVIKVGGNEVDDPAWLERFAGALASTGAGTVLVHGGGKEVTELQRVLGAEPEWHEGLRVTTPEALRAVAMVLSGVVNKRLVSKLVEQGRSAAGISGEDGPTLEAVPALGGRLGETGEIVRVRPELARSLLAAGVIPVVSPVSRGPTGSALNVNADDAASALAAGLEADRFLLVSNVPGVLRADERLAEVSADELEQLIADGVVGGGMIPKLRAAMRASQAGVADVRIGDLSLLTDPSAGTRVVAKHAAVI